MNRSRRHWLQAATLWPACFALRAARKDFWESKDPSAWTSEEKELLLVRSPWAREGVVRMEIQKNRGPSAGYGNDGRRSDDMPQVRPGVPAGGTRSVPIGEKMPPVPDVNAGQPVQFRLLARWESAVPVRLAAGPAAPDLTGPNYVIRLRGLPLMPAPKGKPGEIVANPNERTLQLLKEDARLERKDKRAIPCARLLAGSGDEAAEVLLFFPRGDDAISLSDRLVTLESRFDPFHLSVKFPLADMTYKGKLAL